MNYKRIIRICAGILAVSGLTILFTSLFPILSYEWESGKEYPILISSLVDEETASFTFDDTDYSKVSNWFEGDQKQDFITDEVTYFTISIPKLRIQNATVAIGGEDLSKSLIQYPGTALPGKVGNSAIFGHSILPQFFDPKDYMAIFSTLHTLTKDDTIIVNYDGVTYTYKVETKFEVRPTDIQILEQSRADSYLTLVTCSPPGHPLKPKRLIVRAKLIPQNTVSAV